MIIYSKRDSSCAFLSLRTGKKYEAEITACNIVGSHFGGHEEISYQIFQIWKKLTKPLGSNGFLLDCPMTPTL